MKRIFVFSLFFQITLNSVPHLSLVRINNESDECTQKSAVICAPWAGRFGDQLLAYYHAKWISYKYELLFLYKPFIYSEQLILHDIEINYTDKIVNSFKKCISLKPGDSLDQINLNSETLYELPYFPESKEEYERPQFPDFYKGNFRRDASWFYFTIDWNDKIFISILRNMVRPRTKINLVTPPPNIFSVAVHVRKNSNGFDKPLSYASQNNFKDDVTYVDYIFPLKHVTDEYYIEQIKHVYSMIHNKPMYVFIFTDDTHTIDIMNMYKSQINNQNIEFACRSNNNHHTNVIEDFFSMLNFDCLIRADSNLSIAASKIGNYKIQISPLHHHWEGRKLVIDQVKIEKNEE